MRRGFLLSPNGRDPKPTVAAPLPLQITKNDVLAVPLPQSLSPSSPESTGASSPALSPSLSDPDDTSKPSNFSPSSRIRIPSGFFVTEEPTMSYTEIGEFMYGLTPSPTLCLVWEDTKAAFLSKPNFPASFDPSINTGRFNIVDAPGKGKAMVAARDFTAGDLIVAERPLLLLPESMFRMPPFRSTGEMVAAIVDHAMLPHVKRLFFDLHNARSKDPGITAADVIAETNGLSIGRFPGWPGSYNAVFYYVSRANHSCSPNARRSWDLDTFTCEYRAQRFIRIGEEITISYTDPYEPCEERQRDLLSHWRFSCTCRACSLPPRERAQSDRRRASLRDLYPDNLHEGEFLAWIKDPKLPDDHVLKKYLLFANMMKEEGLDEADDCAAILPPLVKTYCALGDAKNAKRWATKAAGIEKAQSRKDGVWADIAKTPERTAWWGLRRMKVGA